MTLSTKQRTQILRSLTKLVLAHHINVGGIDYGAWGRALDRRTPDLLSAGVEDFETGVKQILSELKTSHTAFYHSLPKELPPQHTINASLRDVERGGCHHWMFLDVFEDGPAYAAGIRPGNILEAVDGASLMPPSTPAFWSALPIQCLYHKASRGVQSVL